MQPTVTSSKAACATNSNSLGPSVHINIVKKKKKADGVYVENCEFFSKIMETFSFFVSFSFYKAFLFALPKDTRAKNPRIRLRNAPFLYKELVFR
jgi:hypothetical protein